MIQTREQRLEQLIREGDRLQTRARAYQDLARHITEIPVPVQAYGRHWNRVARGLRADVVRLVSEVSRIEERIRDLERARHAAETWTRPLCGCDCHSIDRAQDDHCGRCDPRSRNVPESLPESEPTRAVTVAELFDDEDLS